MTHIQQSYSVGERGETIIIVPSYLEDFANDALGIDDDTFDCFD